MPLHGERVRLRHPAHAWARLPRVGGGSAAGGGLGPPVPSPQGRWSAPARGHTLRVSTDGLQRRRLAAAFGPHLLGGWSWRRRSKASLGVVSARRKRRDEGRCRVRPPFWFLLTQQANRTRAPANAGAPLPPLARSARAGEAEAGVATQTGQKQRPHHSESSLTCI